MGTGKRVLSAIGELEGIHGALCTPVVETLTPGTGRAYKTPFYSFPMANHRHYACIWWQFTMMIAWRAVRMWNVYSECICIIDRLCNRTRCRRRNTQTHKVSQKYDIDNVKLACSEGCSCSSRTTKSIFIRTLDRLTLKRFKCPVHGVKTCVVVQRPGVCCMQSAWSQLMRILLATK